MRKLPKNKHELKVGLFVVTPIVLLLLIIMLKLGYSLASSTIDIYMKVETLSSVKDGTAIMIKGYHIGRIVDIRPVFKPELHFLATMRISRDIELREDCSVIIKNQRVLGDTVVEVRNSDSLLPPLQNGDVVEGIEMVSLDTIMQQVNNLLGGLNTTVSGVNSMIGDSRSNVSSLTANLSGTVGKLNMILEDSQKDILEMLKSFRTTAATMEEISQELKKHPMKFLLKD